MALLLPAGARANWDPLLRASQYYEAGWNAGTFQYGSPYGIAVADFDGDGRPDVVVSETVPGPAAPPISVLMHSQYPVTHRLFTPMARGGGLGTVPTYGVATADFDLDGRPDIVAGSRTTPIWNSFVSVVRRTAAGFAPAKVYNMNGATGLVAAGDVNSDGRPDVIVGGMVDGTSIIGIGVMISVTGDSLAPPLLYPVPSTSNQPDVDPRAMVLADATGDGILDVVLAVNGALGPSLYILQGASDGVFTSIDPIATDETSAGLAVGHFNADAIPDIAVTCTSLNRVSVRFGTGGGAFQAPLHHATPVTPGPLCAGDLDGDGDLDLVAVTKSQTGLFQSVAVLRNDGTGTFAAAEVYGGLPGAGQAILVDVDLDGRLDIVVTSYGEAEDAGGHTIGVLLNDGTGAFRDGIAGVSAVSARAEVVGDFNRDGKQDLAIATASNIDLALGNGDGTFASPVVAASGIDADQLFAWDFDRDGDLDLVASTPFGGAVLAGDGGTSFVVVPASIPDRPGAICDLNRDGLLDVIAFSPTEVRPCIQVAGGPVLFQPGTGVAVSVGATAITTGDWNRDGIPDVAVAGSAGLTMHQGLSNGSLSAETLLQSFRAYTAVCAGDFNRDGALDLAAREDRTYLSFEEKSRGIDVFHGFGNGAFAASRSYPTLELRGTTLASWDSNLDGLPDLISSGIDDTSFGPHPLSSVDLLLGTSGEFGFSASYVLGSLTPGTLPQRPLTLGDVDGNGVPDILAGAVGGPTGTTIHTVLAAPPMRGTALQEAAFYPTLNNLWTVAMGDLNRDGKLDVVTGAFGSNPGVAVLLGDGNGGLGPSTTLTQSWNTGHVAVADFNRDGILDIAASNSGFGAPRVSTMLGAGDGTFGARNDYFLLAGNEFEIGDMNRDGIPDVVTVAQDSIRVLVGTGTGHFTAGPAVAIGGVIYDLDLADLNRDGFLDIAVAAGTIQVVYGASGSLGAPMTLAAPIGSGQTLGVADFNDDGFPDIVTNNSGTYYILWGAQVSPFSSFVTTNLPFTAFDIRVGEAASNGIPYLFISRNVTWLEVVSVSQAGALATVGSYSVTSTPFRLALGDLNRDGGIDVVTAGNDGSLVSVNLHGFSAVTGVASGAPGVTRARLGQNYPNPFNPRTTIRYTLQRSERVLLAVFDIHGRLVKTLEDGIRPAGEHGIQWNGRSATGAQVPSGVYLYRLSTASGFAEAKRMVLVK